MSKQKYMYRISKSRLDEGEIFQMRIEKKTKTRVYFKNKERWGKGGGDDITFEQLDSSWGTYFDTWEEARDYWLERHAHMIKKLENRIKDAKKSINHLKNSKAPEEK